MTFFRKDTFELKAAYADDKALFPGMPKELGSYTIEVPSQSEEKKVKVKAALTLHGTFHIQSAQLVEEEVEEGEVAGEQPADAAKEDGDAPMPEAGEEKKRASAERKGKKKLRKTDLTVKASGCPGLPESEVEKRRGQEEKMIEEMREIIETNARKNDLEAYILGMRSGVAEGGKYSEFIKAADREPFSSQLEKAEDWLYDHLDDSKQVFIEKINELKVLGDPVERRFKEETRRPDLVKALEGAAKSLKATAQKPPAKYKTLDKERLKSLEKACEEASQWLAEVKAKQKGLAKCEDPVLECAALEARVEELTRLSDAILEGRQDSCADFGSMASPAAEDDDRGIQRTESEGFARPTAMDVD